MTTPSFTSPELVKLRGGYPRVQKYFALHVPRVLATFELAALPESGASVVVLQYDPGSITGTLPTTLTDLTVLIGDASGDGSRGRVRLRGWDTDNDLMKIGEVGENEILFDETPANNVITVLEQILLWPKVANRSLAMDYDIQSSRDTIDLPPCSIIGPHAVGLVGEAIKFVGEYSDDMDQEGGITSWLWEFPDGVTSTSQGTVASPVTWTPATAYPLGRYFKLTTTIGATGKSHTRWGLVWVFNSYAEALSASIPDIPQGGGEFDVTVWGDDLTGLPSHTACVVWTDTRWPDGTTGGVGGNYPYRGDILFCGWAVGQETVNVDIDTPSVSFRVASHDVMLGKITGGGYNHLITINSDLDEYPLWYSVYRITPDVLLRLFARWRCTLDKVADVHRAGSYGSSVLINKVDIGTGKLWGQLQEIYRHIPPGRIRCDSVGGVWAYLEPNHLSAADRLVYPEVLAIGDSDRIGSFSVERQTLPSVAQVHIRGRAARFYGGEATRTGAYNAVSPAYPQGSYGDKFDAGDYWIPDDQTVLNAWVGAIRGDRNVQYPAVKLLMLGAYRIPPVPPVRVAVSLSGDGGRLNWSGKTFWVTDCTVKWIDEQATFVTLLTLREDGEALPGSTVPVATKPPRPNKPRPPAQPLPPIQGEDMDTWMGQVALVTRKAGAYVCENFSGPNGTIPPVWTRYIDGLPANHTVHDAVSDNFSFGVFYCIIRDNAVGVPVSQSWQLWKFTGSGWSFLTDAETLFGICRDYWLTHGLNPPNAWNAPSNLSIGSVALSRVHQGYVGVVVSGLSGSGGYEALHLYSSDGGGDWQYGDRLTETEDPPTVGSYSLGTGTRYNSEVASDGSVIVHPVAQVGVGAYSKLYRSTNLQTDFVTSGSPVAVDLEDVILRHNPHDGSWFMWKPSGGATCNVYRGSALLSGWTQIASAAPIAAHRYGVIPFPIESGQTVSGLWAVAQPGSLYYLQNVQNGYGHRLLNLSQQCAFTIVPTAPGKFYIFRVNAGVAGHPTIWVADFQHTQGGTPTTPPDLQTFARGGTNINDPATTDSIYWDNGGVMGISIGNTPVEE